MHAKHYHVDVSYIGSLSPSGDTFRSLFSHHRKQRVLRHLAAFAIGIRQPHRGIDSIDKQPERSFAIQESVNPMYRLLSYFSTRFQLRRAAALLARFKSWLCQSIKGKEQQVSKQFRRFKGITAMRDSKI